MNNAVYGKTMEKKQNQNRIDLKLVSNKKDYLKWTLQPSYMSYKIFDNDLVAILSNLIMITLKINKVTTQKYYSQTLILLCMKLKLKMSMKFQQS